MNHLCLPVLFFCFVVVAPGWSVEFVTQNLVVEEVSSGHDFTEGPAPDNLGGIWFTDINAEKIHRFEIATERTTLMFSDSGGANGLLFDNDGHLLAAEGYDQRLTRRNEGVVETLADEWNGQPLNSPNDLIVDSRGGIYFTDPNYYQDVQDEGVYYLSPENQLTQIIGNLERPNGIALSPDESTLYVVELTRTPSFGGSKIWQYKIDEPGAPTNARLFTTGLADGITVDKYGNVFGAQYFGVVAWNSDGTKIFEFSAPEETTNVVLAESHLAYPNTLYVTGGGSLYRIELGHSPPGDLDNDGTLETSDLDQACRYLRRNRFARQYDIDQNGIVDISDLQFSVQSAGIAWGDLNLDGNIGFHDFSILSNGFSSGRDWSDGDLDCNGAVDFADFLMLANNFGVSGLNNVNVPEAPIHSVVMAFLLSCLARRSATWQQRVPRSLISRHTLSRKKS